MLMQVLWRLLIHALPHVVMVVVLVLLLSLLGLSQCPNEL